MDFRESFNRGYFGYLKATTRTREDGVKSFALSEESKNSQSFSTAGPCACPCGDGGNDFTPQDPAGN